MVCVYVSEGLQANWWIVGVLLITFYILYHHVCPSTKVG